MPEYTIRLARHADLDRLNDLLLALQDHLEACNPGLWQMTDEGRANLKGQVAGRLQSSGVRALVAEHERDGVIGVVFGRVITNNRYEPAVAGSIDQAFVRADHRRAGIGTRLVSELCRFFAAEGADELTLRYVVDNLEAAKFWTALGFAPRIVTAGANRQAVEARCSQIEAP